MRDEGRTSLRVYNMPSIRLLLVSVVLLAVSPAMAFEADVHYGLTNWLALQAGFEPIQAQIIATFDQRVDSGDMPFIDVVALYACLGKDETSARRAGEHHYPSAGSVPGPPESREVVPDSKAARKAALEAIEVNPSQAQFRLSKLGEALHVLQDLLGEPRCSNPASARRCHFHLRQQIGLGSLRDARRRRIASRRSHNVLARGHGRNGASHLRNLETISFNIRHSA